MERQVYDQGNNDSEYLPIENIQPKNTLSAVSLMKCFQVMILLYDYDLQLSFIKIEESDNARNDQSKHGSRFCR